MSVVLAQRLMDEFAVSTGVTGQSPPRRYLWIDAFFERPSATAPLISFGFAFQQRVGV